MAIWTKNFKILHIIIMTVSVFMMNAKYFRFVIVTTSFTFINQFTANHCFSYSGEGWFKSFLRCFINTGFRAIFSIVTSMANKFLKAMLASIFGFSFISLSHIVTSRRAILSFIAPRRDMSKGYVTDNTISSNFGSSIFCLATT